MPKTLLIGVDLGTSATKAGLYEPDGRLIAEASVDVPILYPAPGVVEQDHDDFVRTAAEAVRAVLHAGAAAPGDVAAIGFDSQMAGIGSIDDDFAPAARFDSWLDMRCQPYIERMADHGDLVTRVAGCPPTCAHGAKMLWWRHERPEEFRRIAKFVTPAGYVAGRLAGLKAKDAFIDHTFLHFTGAAATETGEWSDELCATLGLAQDKLPRIVPPWEVVGVARGALAEAFGLRPGTPVVAGAGDTAASALGAGIVRPGMMLDVAGTASVLAGCTDRFAPDVNNRVLLVMRSIVPGLWHPLAYVGGGGLALTWFRDRFGAGSSVEELAKEAAAIAPGSEGLLFSPHLGGRICPADPEQRGRFHGFSWGHGRAHFFRAILESIAFEYAGYLGIIETLTPHIGRLEARVVGGGARSGVWNRIKADVLGVPYRPLARADLATWGTAIVAGHGIGLIPDMASAAARSSEDAGDPVMPDPVAHDVYRPLVRTYIDWQRSQDHP
ncbi:MAG TPA: FGGY family carbohydrate kinase [Bauldia sp.]|nr:FGGY family carbohydrate kinase [Bauldia sp.]